MARQDRRVSDDMDPGDGLHRAYHGQEQFPTRLVDFIGGLDAEDHRAAKEGLSEDEYALFCLLQKDKMAKTDREKVKLASRGLLDSLRKLIAQRERWTEKEQTQAEVEVLILDNLLEALPTPPFTAEEKESAARRVYQHVWQQSASGCFASAASTA